jgi:hypothetical protein
MSPISEAECLDPNAIAAKRLVACAVRDAFLDKVRPATDAAVQRALCLLRNSSANRQTVRRVEQVSRVMCGLDQALSRGRTHEYNAGLLRLVTLTRRSETRFPATRNGSEG